MTLRPSMPGPPAPSLPADRGAAGGQAAEVAEPGSWTACTAVPGGYAWWYADAMDAAGNGLVCILFAGSVFSPDYARRLRQGEPAMPLEHTAVNLALYRRGRQVAWVMSEYRGAHLLSDERVAIGGTTFERQGAGARIEIAERTAPFITVARGARGRRVEGEIAIEALTGPCAPCAISEEGRRHAWQALAPRALVRARFTRPAFEVEATGYLDRNHGDGRLEDAFSRWGWARFHGARETTVIYAFEDRKGHRRTLAARCPDGDRGASPFELAPGPEGASRRAGWGLYIPSRFGGESLFCQPTGLLERSPFYARYRARLAGGEHEDGRAVGLGEWLDLDRFRSRWNQHLLRFKTRAC